MHVDYVLNHSKLHPHECGHGNGCRMHHTNYLFFLFLHLCYIWYIFCTFVISCCFPFGWLADVQAVGLLDGYPKFQQPQFESLSQEICKLQYFFHLGKPKFILCSPGFKKNVEKHYSHIFFMVISIVCSIVLSTLVIFWIRDRFWSVSADSTATTFWGSEKYSSSLSCREREYEHCKYSKGSWWKKKGCCFIDLWF